MVTKSPNVQPSWVTLRAGKLPFSARFDRRAPIVALIILAIAAAVMVISINTGQYNMTVFDVIQTLLGTNTDHADYKNFSLVVHTFRLPRIMLAFLVGMALATSGTLMQGLTRNPLADPFLLGVSSGAGLAAVTVIVVMKKVALSELPFWAFAGALATAAIIYTLSRKDGTSSPIRLILIGIAIEATLGAFTTLILTFGNINDVQQAYVWLSGSVYGRNWEHVHVMLGWIAVGLPAAFLTARALNMMGLGDDTAKGLGLAVEAQRIFLLIVAVMLAAASVSMAGTIGFVGLVAPHIVRRLVGPSHEALIPISALFGGLLVMTADLIGRWVIAPSELPVGIVTAMIGAPYFLYLLFRNRNK